MEPITPNENIVWEGLVGEYGVGVPIPLAKLLSSVAEHYPAKEKITSDKQRRIVRTFLLAGLLERKGEFDYLLTAKSPTVKSPSAVAMSRGNQEHRLLPH